MIAYSGRVQVTLPTVRAIVKCFCNCVPGPSTTSFRLRLFRGNTNTGTPMGNSAFIVPAAGALAAEITLTWSEQLLSMEYVDYSVWLQQAAATGSGTTQMVLLEVELING